MKKWIGPCLSLVVVIVLLFLTGPSGRTKEKVVMDGEGKGHPLVLTQDKKVDKREDDSQFIQILTHFQEIVDGWLKSLNERIESEEVTRFEVRFLEILRNILEWVDEKLADQIESARKKQKQREKGSFREAGFMVSPFDSTR